MAKNKGVYIAKTGSMKSDGGMMKDYYDSSPGSCPSGTMSKMYSEVQSGGSFINNSLEVSDKCANQRAAFIKGHRSDVPY